MSAPERDEAFDALMSAADPAMVVVTTAAEGERAGCLVGFHGQASIDPQRYAVWLSKANHTYRVALRASHHAVHFLGADDVAMAELFGTRSGEDVDKFADVAFEDGPHGVPLLTALPRRIVLERIALLDDGGDHVCLTGRPLLAEGGDDFEPLRVAQVAHLDPGRPAEARAIDPHD
jgi:flavin reductase (DIM6/NTAB) family NADH-FMN oxidoreductase RutF